MTGRRGRPFTYPAVSFARDVTRALLRRVLRESGLSLGDRRALLLELAADHDDLIAMAASPAAPD